MIKPNNAKLIFAAMVFIGGVATADEHGHVDHQFAKDDCKICGGPVARFIER